MKKLGGLLLVVMIASLITGCAGKSGLTGGNPVGTITSFNQTNLDKVTMNETIYVRDNSGNITSTTTNAITYTLKDFVTSNASYSGYKVIDAYKGQNYYGGAWLKFKNDGVYGNNNGVETKLYSLPLTLGEVTVLSTACSGGGTATGVIITQGQENVSVVVNHVTKTVLATKVVFQVNAPCPGQVPVYSYMWVHERLGMPGFFGVKMDTYNTAGLLLSSSVMSDSNQN